MFILFIAQIFSDSKLIRISLNILKYLNWVLLIALTAGLINRWYVSGLMHLSDAYESVLYVYWAIILFGLLMGSKSHLCFVYTAFVGAVVFWVVYFNWMDGALCTVD